VIDAWGSIPNGLLTGNLFDLGNFDECLSIEEVVGGKRIRGKYCFLLANSARIATCFPASCSSTQMETFVEQLMALINLNSSSLKMRISGASCQTSEIEPWNGLTIFTMYDNLHFPQKGCLKHFDFRVILSLMCVIVISVTIFDYFLCDDPSKYLNALPPNEVLNTNANILGSIPAVVKTFSARANSRALFRIVPNKSNPNVIECFHGIRCMTLFWVIYCHEFIFFLTSPNLNRLDLYTVRIHNKQTLIGFVIMYIF